MLSNIHAILKATQMVGYGEQLDTSMSCVLVQTTLLYDFLVKSYNLKHMKLVILQKLPVFVLVYPIYFLFPSKCIKHLGQVLGQVVLAQLLKNFGYSHLNNNFTNCWFNTCNTLMSKNFRASKIPNFDTLVTFKLLCKQVSQPNLLNQ